MQQEPVAADLTAALASSEATIHWPFDAFQTSLKTRFMMLAPAPPKREIEYF